MTIAESGSGKPTHSIWAYVAIASLIVILAGVFRNFLWAQDLTDAAFDWIIKVEAKREGGKPVSDNPNSEDTGIIPVLFFEVTGREYKNDGFPVITPRNRIAYLIRKAWEKKVPVVVVDSLLEHRDYKNPRGDRDIRNLLTEMIKRNNTTHVIFSVAKRSDETYSRLLVDDLIDSPGGRKFFHRGLAGIKASYWDGIARFWVSHDIARPSLSDDSGYRILWGVPILATALIKDMNEKSPIDHIGKLTTWSRDMEEIANRKAASGEDSRGVEKKRFEVDFNGPHQVIEIEYPRHRTVRGTLLVPYIPDSPSFRCQQRIRFQIVPGQPSMTGRQFSSDNIEDLHRDLALRSVVVIGNSSFDTGDVHQTPMRYPMQGMYILGNAINTVSNGLVPHPIHWLDYLIVFATVMFIPYVKVPYNFNKILISAVLSLLLWVISWYLFEKMNLFLNLLLPIAAVGLYTGGAHAIDNLKDIFKALNNIYANIIKRFF